MPAGQVPLQVGNAPHGRKGRVVVVVGVVVVGQLGPLPDVEQASQQLVHVPPPVPPRGGVQRFSATILHVVPVVVAKQQVTAFGLPQVECAAHRFTAPLQLGGRLGLVPLDSVLTMCATHFI